MSNKIINAAQVAMAAVTLSRQYEKLVEENNKLKERNQEIVDGIQYKMKMIKSDHANSTGTHLRYLTGQYDAYDYMLQKHKQS